MTKQHSTARDSHKSNICQTRTLKVRESSHSYQQNQPSQQRTEIGQIELKGRWLIEAGFEINTSVKVRIMAGCLVLTSAPQPATSLKGFSQLNQREKQVIKDILKEFLKLKKE